MNILLWVLQILAALVYGASGVMKVFLFDKVSADVPSFGALPRQAWTVLGIIELCCTIALILPSALHWKPTLTVAAATTLALAEPLTASILGVTVLDEEMTAQILTGMLLVFAGLVVLAARSGRRDAV